MNFSFQASRLIEAMVADNPCSHAIGAVAWAAVCKSRAASGEAVEVCSLRLGTRFVLGVLFHSSTGLCLVEKSIFCAASQGSLQACHQHPSENGRLQFDSITSLIPVLSILVRFVSYSKKSKSRSTPSSVRPPLLEPRQSCEYVTPSMHKYMSLRI